MLMTKNFIQDNLNIKTLPTSQKVITMLKKIATLNCLLSTILLINAQDLCKQHVKQKLAAMVNADQKMRRKIDFLHLDESLIQEMRKIDETNAKALKAILNAYNWITISEFGKEADHHAWLLVQHADHDLSFQKEVLNRLEKLYPVHETNACNYAYLYDRVAVAENRPQLYGTQGSIRDGKWIPYEIENVENLDASRSSVGLSSYNEYVNLIHAAYNLKS